MSSAQIGSLKTPPISLAMKELLVMIDLYTEPVLASCWEPAGLRVWVFRSNYPKFTDTNNPSLLIFVKIGDILFALGGDLERAGRLEFLRNARVRELLRQVDVFVVSHHGHENGYCQEVFDFCRPLLVVISGRPIQYDTQRMASIHSKHASGEWFQAHFRMEWRKFVSTRIDGNIWWEI